MPTVKQAVGWLVVIFILFYIVTQPSRAADTAHSIWNLIVDVYHGLADFITAL